MFYVKGNSYLLSFSRKRLDIQQQEEEAAHIIDTTQQQHLNNNSSFFSHFLFVSSDMLPTFLIVASSMSLLAYLYSILMIPMVMTATIPTLGNQTANATRGIEVPLDIHCPFLTPRTEPTKNVHDLRPDDIHIVMGLGDRYIKIISR